ncbi:hypothetical protein SLEP1_g29024 [Rubroshorea leprosula]|uniref:Uncharacterized protein n=1 Tax=Rubroshorea leprosula TaxID=152421 RepID=A0AAV5K2N0_9ROSI|nr:hypothetical protein SLEP1_g29024 [Rubroshorea leprosula]
MFVSKIECYKHQHHHQLQGVCPYCLTEKLSHLSLTSNREIVRVAPSCSSSSSASYSPALGPSSGFASPERRRRHQRNISEVAASIHYVLGIGNFSLRKSRSVAFAHGNFGGEVRNGKKKKGFWSKLLGLKGKKEVLMHSRTVRV